MSKVREEGDEHEEKEALLPAAATVAAVTGQGKQKEGSSGVASTAGFFSKMANPLRGWFKGRSTVPGRDDRLRPLNADTFADAVASFAKQAADSGVAGAANDFAEAAEVFAKAEESDRAAAAVELRAAAASLSDAAANLDLAAANLDLAADTEQLALAMEALLSACPPPREEMGQKDSLDPGSPSAEAKLKCLVDSALRFKNAAASSTMAKASDAFYKAANSFASGKDWGKKVVDTELSKAGVNLLQAAAVAKQSKEDDQLASEALKLVEDSGDLLLDDSFGQEPPQQQRFFRCCFPCGSWFRVCSGSSSCWKCCCCCEESFCLWISGGPLLPLHRHQVARQAKLVERRMWIYALALGTPIALLTSLKAAKVLSVQAATWIGGITAGVWILVSIGAMVNMFGVTSGEMFCARHVSSLGVMALVALFVIYMFTTFFPGAKTVFWIMLGVAIGLHGLYWALGCYRGDDDSFASGGDDTCTCARCSSTCKCVSSTEEP